MGKADWLLQRSRGVHLTIRDVDVIDFDAAQLAEDLHRMYVNVLSFFCAGYVTVHPTGLDKIRVSPFLGDRDVTGEIVRELHDHGIYAVAAVDLSLVPGNAAKEHPEWCSCDEHGVPYRANRDLGDFYIACPMSGYQNEYIAEILKELTARYELDGIKFGGGSYGFQQYGSGICHCSRCRESFREYSGMDIPARKDWSNPLWGTFQRWRQERVVQRSKFLYELVKSLDPEMPVMCNSVCFGETGWTTNGSLDIERMAKYIDAVQVEAQTRVRVNGTETHWDYLLWPGEEANYLSTVSDRQTWVLASYFQAWPWRRNAVPPHEQKVYMAQIYANGGSAILNLSGGPPKVHEDKRGFPAVTSLYRFVADRQEYFDNDSSAANVAIVYSQDTLFYYGKDDPKARYVDAIRGFEQTFSEHHIPFDIISDSMLTLPQLSRYRTVCLPCTACMTEQSAAALRTYVQQGGNLIATFETSLFDPDGEQRSDFVLADLFGASYNGTSSVMGENDGVYKQAYINIRQPGHYVLSELGDTQVVPAAGFYCHVKASGKAEVPLTLSSAFRVFPEGMSYTLKPDTDHPMLIASSHPGGGKVVYFPGQPDGSFMRIGYPDWGLLLVNAVKWTLDGDLPLQAEAPTTLNITLRKQEGRRLVHLINLTGGRRMFHKLSAIHDVHIQLKAQPDFVPRRAYLLSDGETLSIKREQDAASVRIARIADYDVLVFES